MKRVEDFFSEVFARLFACLLFFFLGILVLFTPRLVFKCIEDVYYNRLRTGK